MASFLPDSPLVDSVIQARYFTPGPRTSKITRLVIHDTESPEVPTGAENVAKWWAGSTSAKSSAHHIVDNNSIVQAVKEADIAWHCPGINHNGIGVEHVGYAKQLADGTGWYDAYSQAMLKLSARLFADLCVRHEIPPVFLKADDLKAGKSGITTHAEGSLAYKKGGHYDPGRNFPLDQFMGYIRAEHAKLVTPPAPINPIIPPPAEGEDARIIGADHVDLGQAERYINSRRPQGANGYPMSDVHTILNAYQGTCITVGASFGICVAQLVHETGYLTSFWSARPQRNPAGIGVSGAAYSTEAGAKATKQPYAYDKNYRDSQGRPKPWRLGNSFANWAPGAVDAHVGRLCAYAIPLNGGDVNQQRLIGIALAARPLPIKYRGCAPTLAGLRGTWAVPGTLYPQALWKHIDAMSKS